MQMFNGCTMWVLGHFYCVNFDNLESEKKWNGWWVENFEKELNDITKEISEITDALSDEPTDNDDEAKKKWKELLDSLKSRFNDSVMNYFKDKPDKLTQLKTVVESSIQKLKEKNGWELPVEYKPLQDFLDEISKSLDSIAVESNQNFPEFPIEWNWGKPKAWDEKKLHRGLVRERPAEWQEEPDEKLRFYEVAEKINGRGEEWGLIAKVSALKTKENLNDDIKVKLENLGTILSNINKVMDNTSIDNVKLLQVFISENLSGDDKVNFDAKSYSKKNKGFDGKFWDGTLAWLNLVINKIEKYIIDITETLKQAEVSDKLNNVKVKENATIQKNGEIKPEDLVDGLTEWLTVALIEWQNLKTDEVGKSIDVKLNVKLNSESWVKEKPLVAKVTVVDGVSTKSKTSLDADKAQSPIDTTPLSVDGGQHLVMKNSPTIARNTGLRWATFYFWDKFTGKHPGEWQHWNPAEVPSNGLDYKCYMKIKGNPNTYEVMVDKNWNISPVAINVDSKVSVLLKNNESCKRYLANKVPEWLSPRPIIWWDNSKQDYAVISYNKSLTVEPMTIRGKWVSPDLWDCLALLNFTNFLRWAGEISDIKFKNGDPDLELRDDGNLYVRVNKKSNRIYDENWKLVKNGGWYKVPMQRFWLDRIKNKEEVLKNFIKYNNGEHWEDKWDKKKANKYYKKI